MRFYVSKAESLLKEMELQANSRKLPFKFKDDRTPEELPKCPRDFVSSQISTNLLDNCSATFLFDISKMITATVFGVGLALLK
jgi:hypothetical protein